MNEAYTTVIVDGGWQIGLATQGVRGYLPLGQVFDNQDIVDEIVADLNERLGLSELEALKIVASSIKAQSKERRERA
jgi:hypothetical protein